MQQVRQDPQGGVYFYNASMVVHYDTGTGFTPVLTNHDLTIREISINDLDAPIDAIDGRVYLATDDGIYTWKHGAVVGHLTRSDGIGTSPVVRTVRTDRENRAWFSTPGYVGYFKEPVQPYVHLGIEIAASPSATTPPVTATATTTASPPPELHPRAGILPSVFPPDSPLNIFNPLVDPIVRALRALNITPGT
jgi:hypothetical protein